MSLSRLTLSILLIRFRFITDHGRLYEHRQHGAAVCRPLSWWFRLPFAVRGIDLDNFADFVGSSDRSCYLHVTFALSGCNSFIMARCRQNCSYSFFFFFSSHEATHTDLVINRLVGLALRRSTSRWLAYGPLQDQLAPRRLSPQVQ